MDGSTLNAIFLVFVYKSLDCVFNTLKTIYLYKNKYFLSSMFNTLSTIFYFIAVVKAATSNDIYVICAAGLATLVGSYLPAKIAEYLEKDKVFIYDITSDNFENGVTYADLLREQNLPVRTMKVYDKDMNRALNCKVYSESKTISKMIEDNMPPQFKFTVITSRIEAERGS